MKKKLLTTLLASASALCCAFGLVGCNGSGNNGDNNGGGEELTDAEWMAAFDSSNFANFTQNTKIEQIFGDQVEVGYQRTKVDLANKRFGFTSYLLSDGEEVIVVAGATAKIDGMYYDYLYFMGEDWQQEAMNGYTDDDFTAEFIDPVTVTNMMLRDAKDSFTFKNGVYSADSITVGYEGVYQELANVKISFKNGKIDTLSFEQPEDSENPFRMRMEETFTDYGTTEITLPNVQEQGGTTVTESEWFALLSSFVQARNFTLDRTIDGEFSAGMKLQGTTYYERYDSGVENILVRAATNEYYRYSTWGNEWVKYTSNEKEYKSYTGFAEEYIGGAVLAFGEQYSEFEYSEGKYTAASITVAPGFVLTDIEVSFEGKILKKVVCTWDDEVVTIYDIGTTTIELPKNFTEGKS